MAAVALAPLSVGDRAELARLEAVIDGGRETFRAVALALLEIRDRRLYRAEFPTFEAYCRERWGFSAGHGRRLIRAGWLILDREFFGLPPPANERQARHMQRGELQQRIADSRPGLAKTAAIEKLLARLKALHAAHPHRTRADELLALYRETVLPWPAHQET